MQNYFWAVLSEIVYFSTERELKTTRSFIITDRVLQHFKSMHKKNNEEKSQVQNITGTMKSFIIFKSFFLLVPGQHAYAAKATLHVHIPKFQLHKITSHRI